MSNEKTFIFPFYIYDLQENTYSKLETLILELILTGLELPGSIFVIYDACLFRVKKMCSHKFALP